MTIPGDWSQTADGTIATSVVRSSGALHVGWMDGMRAEQENSD